MSNPNNKMLPISIVVTVFNDSESIENFLKNIDNQSCHPSELIIVDGGSSDNTSELILEFSKYSKFKIILVSEGKRLNISEGLNQGIKNSSFSNILIAGTGNFYDIDFIKELWIAKEKSINKIFYSSVLGQKNSNFSDLFNKYFLNGNQCFDWEPSNHGVLIHKSIFKNHGLFWEGFHYAGEDSEFFNRVTQAGELCEYVQKAILYWETPRNWKEYNRKMQVNAIADLQINSTKSMCFKIFIPLMLIFSFIFLLYKSKAFIFLAIFAIIALMIKKNTYDVASVLLGISSKFIVPFHYLMQRKFRKKAFKVTKSEFLH